MEMKLDSKEKELQRLNESEIKAKLLEILVKFDNLCRENHLQYFLGGGTLLGAVRHKGFIPWDDDIDVMMPRKDYERMITLVSNDSRHDITFFLSEYKSNKSHIHPFAKICNGKVIVRNTSYKRFRTSIIGEEPELYIDIFPIDGVPETRIKQKWFFFIVKLYKYFIAFSVRRFGKLPEASSLILKYIKLAIIFPVVLVCRVIGHTYFLRKLEHFVMKYDYGKSIFVAACTGRYGLSEVEQKKVFGHSVDMQFENFFFSVPAGYDNYLRHHYGDYMQLPKEADRITHFDGEVYIKRDSSLDICE
jgi:lipopolysaccharide cholinephosphotransferase